MSVILNETFESYVAGALENQGGWPSQAGGADPQVNVVGGSLIDGVNSIRLADLGGGPTTALGVPYTLASPLTTGHPWRIRVRAIAPDGSDGAGGLHGTWIHFLAGALDLSAVGNGGEGANVALSICVHEGQGANADKAIVDNIAGWGGGPWVTGIAVDTKLTLDIIVNPNGTIQVYLNGAGPDISVGEKLIAGKETITGLAVVNDGTYSLGSVYDSILIVNGVEPTGETAEANENVPVVDRGTSITPVGEDATATGNAPVLARGTADAPVGETAEATGNAPVINRGTSTGGSETAAANENTPVINKGFSIGASVGFTLTGNAVVVAQSALAPPQGGTHRQDLYFNTQTREELVF